MPRPICFAIMPFRTKDTGATPPAPATVDFDALWEKALLPLIEQLGYQPVRADQDLGGMIIKQMLERLYFSDLVLADLTLPNGNVYYEVGVRHAAKPDNCVLISADWSRQLFDLNQIRQARYPLPEGRLTDEAAKAIRDALRSSINELRRGATPVYQTLPGYPEQVRPDRATVISEFLDQVSAFQAEVRAVRASPAKDRKSLALTLRDRHPAAQMRLPGMVVDLVNLLRDCADWPDTLAYIDALPAEFRELTLIQEQRCLALSKTGDHADAIGALEELIRLKGETPERHGLIGGRYKRLMASATSPVERARYLSKAISHYERGMMLDLNDYYPSCNLPRLYRQRGRTGDAERAAAAATVARLACERSIARGIDDGWTRQTLLTVAFFEGHVEKIDELADQIIDEGPAAWRLESTLGDLAAIAEQTPDSVLKNQLGLTLDRLQIIAKP